MDSVKNPAAKPKSKERSRSEGNVPKYVQWNKNTNKKPMDNNELQENLRRNIRDNKSKNNKEPLQKFKFTIPKGPAGGERPDGTFYPGSSRDGINNNPEGRGKFGYKNVTETKVDLETYFKTHGLQNKACQTEITAIGGEVEVGTKSVIRCSKIRDPKANHRLDLPRKERGREFDEKIINPTIPITEEGWVDIVRITNKKWTVRQSPPKDRKWRDEIIDDTTTESLSSYLIKSYSRSFDNEEKEEYILPNDTAEENKVYDKIPEEETHGVIIDNTEDYDPNNKTWIPDDAQDEDYVAFAPSSQEIKFLKDRE